MKDEINIYLDKLVLDKDKQLYINHSDFCYCKSLDDIRGKLHYYGDSKHASEIRFFNLISNEINYCYDSKKQKEDELIYKYLGEKRDRDLNSKVKIKIYPTETAVFSTTIKICKDDLQNQIYELEKTIKKYEAEKKHKRTRFIIFLSTTIFSVVSIITSIIILKGFNGNSVVSIILLSLMFTFLNYIINYEIFD